MSVPSYSELSGRSFAAGERREVTAVSIPGRFLPQPDAEAAAVSPVDPASEEPSAEIAAAVQRLVASTDDAARGLTGFCWDPEDEPAPPQLQPLRQIRQVVALQEESTPLPQPVPPRADFLAELAAADLPSLMMPREAAAVSGEFEVPTAVASWADEAAFLPSAVAPTALEVATEPSAVVAAAVAVAAVPSAVVPAAREAAVVPRDIAAAAREVSAEPSEVSPAADEFVAESGEVVPAAVAAAAVPSAVVPAAREVAAGPVDVARAAPQATPSAVLPAPSSVVLAAGEAAFLPREGMLAAGEVVRAVAATPAEAPHLFVDTPPLASPAAPAPDEAAWAPVGFSPEMTGAAGAKASASSAPVRTVVPPLSALTPVRPVPAAVAVVPQTTDSAQPRPGAAVKEMAAAWMLRSWQTLQAAGQWLRRTGGALASAVAAQLRNFWTSVRAAAARIELQLAWPTDLRTALPWIIVGALVLVSFVILISSHSCGESAEPESALSRRAAIALQVGTTVPPQATR